MREARETSQGAFPLRLAAEGEAVRIEALSRGGKFSDRLAGMGLALGAELEVLQNQGCGRLVVAHQGTRLFLGGGMAQKIHVVIVKEDLK